VGADRQRKLRDQRIAQAVRLVEHRLGTTSESHRHLSDPPPAAD
jgi:hypothetical protein